MTDYTKQSRDEADATTDEMRKLAADPLAAAMHAIEKFDRAVERFRAETGFNNALISQNGGVLIPWLDPLNSAFGFVNAAYFTATYSPDQPPNTIVAQKAVDMFERVIHRMAQVSRSFSFQLVDELEQLGKDVGAAGIKQADEVIPDLVNHLRQIIDPDYLSNLANAAAFEVGLANPPQEPPVPATSAPTPAVSDAKDLLEKRAAGQLRRNVAYAKSVSEAIAGGKFEDRLDEAQLAMDGYERVLRKFADEKEDNPFLINQEGALKQPWKQTLSDAFMKALGYITKAQDSADVVHPAIAAPMLPVLSRLITHISDIDRKKAFELIDQLQKSADTLKYVGNPLGDILGDMELPLRRIIYPEYERNMVGSAIRPTENGNGGPNGGGTSSDLTTH